jgi:hypothetical protein
MRTEKKNLKDGIGKIKEKMGSKTVTNLKKIREKKEKRPTEG